MSYSGYADWLVSGTAHALFSYYVAAINLFWWLRTCATPVVYPSESVIGTLTVGIRMMF